MIAPSSGVPTPQEPEITEEMIEAGAGSLETPTAKEHSPQAWALARRHARHVLEAALAGRTVVALPEPDEILTDDPHIRPTVRWNASSNIIPDGYVVSAIGCSFGPKVNVRGGPFMDPDVAEQYAAMLLAAAREACRLASEFRKDGETHGH